MITLCWGAKGGSGVTTVAAMSALARRRPTLLIDLDGDAALALGLGSDEAPTIDDWFASDAPADRLSRLARSVATDLRLIPARGRVPRQGPRWSDLADFLVGADHHVEHDVVVDAGAGPPPPELHEVATASLLVMRPCYLTLIHAQRLAVRPHGIVLVEEPWRSFRHEDIASAIGAPIVATVSLDPKIARAVDSGLAVSRLPAGCVRQLRGAA